MGLSVGPGKGVSIYHQINGAGNYLENSTRPVSDRSRAARPPPRPAFTAPVLIEKFGIFSANRVSFSFFFTALRESRRVIIYPRK